MVGQSLANGLRNTDWPVRWGGEEFLIILPGITAQGLAVTAERLRMLVEHSWIQLPDEQVRVTISAGAIMVDPVENVAEALDRADLLMYESKSGGRNRVTLETGEVLRTGQITRSWEMRQPGRHRRSG
jgi:diguanylate cyclase (GGDEF)-like protein